ncbi:MAG: hypothetical protein QOH24_1546, partial [Verrucomicrobiota bacterium]
MKAKLCLLMLLALIGVASSRSLAQATPSIDATANAVIFQKLADAKWDKILPDLGESSPEICILRIDPTTHATQLLIRTAKAIHIRKHWHTANET